MPRPRALIALALLAPSLAACGNSDNDPGPGGVTVGEARALDEAAEMIEKRQLPKEVLRPPMAAPSVAATGSSAP